MEETGIAPTTLEATGKHVYPQAVLHCAPPQGGPILTYAVVFF